LHPTEQRLTTTTTPTSFDSFSISRPFLRHVCLP
jgi:hypothetical protein